MLLLEDEDEDEEEAEEEATAAGELEETVLVVATASLAATAGAMVATGALELVEDEADLCLAGHAEAAEMAERAMSMSWNFMVMRRVDKQSTERVNGQGLGLE